MTKFFLNPANLGPFQVSPAPRVASFCMNSTRNISKSSRICTKTGHSAHENTIFVKVKNLLSSKSSNSKIRWEFYFEITRKSDGRPSATDIGCLSKRERTLLSARKFRALKAITGLFYKQRNLERSKIALKTMKVSVWHSNVDTIASGVKSYLGMSSNCKLTDDIGWPKKNFWSK